MTLLEGPDIDSRLAGGQWHRDGDAISRDLEFADFAGAIAFVQKVAQAAETADHHPDILVHGWNKVRLTLSTHSQGGVTEADIAMATTIDGLG